MSRPEPITADRPKSWWDLYPRVFAGEMREMQRLNASANRPALRARFEAWAPGSEDATLNPVRLIMTGVVRVKAAAPGGEVRWHQLKIEIGYPPNFPFAHPDIRPVDGRITRRRHQLGKSRELCYVQEALQPWRPGRGLEQALTGAREWLRGEVTQDWPKEVQAADLLSYLDGQSTMLRVVLIPDHARHSPTTARWGTFDVEVPQKPSLPAIVGAFRVARSKLAVTPAAPLRDTNDRLWASLAAVRWAEPVRGMWFRLQREPRPFHDLSGLLAALRDAGEFPDDLLPTAFTSLVDAAAAQRRWLPVALEYPARKRPGAAADATEWLLVTLEWPMVHAKGTMRGRAGRRAANRNPRLVPLQSVKVKGVPSYDVSASALRRRTGGLYPPPDERRHAIIVGLGALGSTVAKALAAAGYRLFTLVEPDVMAPGNVVRHELRMPSVGSSKLTEMRQLILQVNPYATVRTISGTRGADRQFEQAVLAADPEHTLIVSLTGNKAVEGQVDAIAARAMSPIEVLHAWVYPNAQFLRAFVFRAGRTACTWCTDLYRLDAEEGATNTYILPPKPKDAGLDELMYEASCVDPAQPGAGNANAMAAHVIAEHAMKWLERRVEDDATHWTFVGARVHDLDPDFPFPPMSEQVGTFTPHPKCHMCALHLLEHALSLEEQADHAAFLALAGARDVATVNPAAHEDGALSGASAHGTAAPAVPRASLAVEPPEASPPSPGRQPDGQNTRDAVPLRSNLHDAA